MPESYNDNTYARMDTSFRLYEHGDQFIRITNGNPVTINYSYNLAIKREGDSVPKLTLNNTETLSQQPLNMASNKVTNLADPTNE
jgi:hypothetical protein